MQIFSVGLPVRTSSPRWKKALFKTLLLMKLTVLLLTAFMVTAHAESTAQTITISGTNLTLDQVLKSVKKQTGYAAIYNEESVDGKATVSLSFKNVSLNDLLDYVSKQLSLEYVIRGKTIVLLKKVKNDLPVTTDPLVKLSTPIQISGRVVNADREPLLGASVKIKGANTGVSTNANGDFSISANPGQELEISFVGFRTQTISVGTETQYYIKLEPSESPLDEVQVLAYSKTTKRFATGNVATVKAAEIEKQPVNNPLLALQGRVPGLVITQNSGVPGGAVTVRIQGRNSLSAGSDPLYVIDGVPIMSQLPSIGMGETILGTSGEPTGPTSTVGNYNSISNPLALYSPSDIESIEVLKDADATSVFGSRASNGAILITTKKGKVQGTRVDVGVQSSWSRVAKEVDLLNSRQYLDMRYEAFANDGINWRDPSVRADDLKVWDTTRYTNWQKELLGNTAHTFQTNVGVSGGNSGIRYRLAGTYARETTIFAKAPSQDDQANTRASMTLNLSTQSSNQRLRLNFNAAYANGKSQLPLRDLAWFAFFLPPTAPAMLTPSGAINWAPNAAGVSTFGSSYYSVNPMQVVMGDYQMTTNNLIAGLNAQYKLFKGMEVGANMGLSSTRMTEFSSLPKAIIPIEEQSFSFNNATYGNTKADVLNFEPKLEYRTKLGRGRLDAQLIGSFRKDNVNGFSVRGERYQTDALLENISSAGQLYSFTSIIRETRYMAQTFIGNYNLDDTYIFNVSARRDASTKFANSKQLSTFASVGTAWIFTQHKIVRKYLPFLTFGKLRASYGLTGNDQFGDYLAIPRYGIQVTQVPYQGIVSYSPTILPSPRLQWERTRKLSTGVSLGFLDNRFLVNVDYNRNTTSDQIGTYPLPNTTGFTNYIFNLPATVRNTNWEFTLTSTNIHSKNLEWATAFTGTIARNKLVSYPELEKSPYAHQYAIGQSIDMRRIARFNAVDPITGQYTFLTSKGEITDLPTYPDDYIFANFAPTFYGGLNNNLKYKQFDLSFFLQFTKQVGKNFEYGTTAGFPPGGFGPYNPSGNQPVAVVNRWRTNGDRASVRKYTTSTFLLDVATFLESDAAFTDASFIRMKNVNIGYTVSQAWAKRMKLTTVRFSISAQNLFTLTKYKGIDPETMSFATTPPLRTLSANIQIGL